MQTVPIDSRIHPFVKEVMLLESSEEREHELPFYADGYPGIMYSKTKDPILLQPYQKLLPNFFLYGQTVEPIKLIIGGSYDIIVFQLYPFATRLLIGVNPKEIKDACYDLNDVEGVETEATVAAILQGNLEEQVNAVSEYILALVKNSSSNLDNTIKLAVSTIINTKGLITISALREQLYITERTFERRFANEVGVTPKQFAKIIQFSFSMNQIQEGDYDKLTNIAYDNGFADQSHFIRTFKKYTGGSPREVLGKMK